MRAARRPKGREGCGVLVASQAPTPANAAAETPRRTFWRERIDGRDLIAGLLSGPSGSKRRASDSVLNDGQFAVAGGPVVRAQENVLPGLGYGPGIFE